MVRSAWVYVLCSSLFDWDIEAIKKYLINPVEARGSLEKPETLMVEYEVPESVSTLHGFRSSTGQGLRVSSANTGLQWTDDIAFLQKYFIEGRATLRLLGNPHD